MVIFLSYIAYFIAASASPLQRRWLAVNREQDGGGQIDFAFRTVAIIAVLGLSLLFFQPPILEGGVVKLSLLTLATGIFGAGFFSLQFIAQKHVDAGITTLASNVYTPITIVLAWFLLGEGLTGIQVVGAILLFLSIFLISKKHRTGVFRFDKYFVMMIISGICLGALLTAERALQLTTGFTTGTLFSWWSQCLALGALTVITKSKTLHSAKDIAITGMLKFFQGLSWVTLIFVVGNLGIVSAVTTFKVVLIFLTAAIFLNEREDLPRKIFGSFVAVAGLLLMK